MPRRTLLLLSLFFACETDHAPVTAPPPSDSPFSMALVGLGGDCGPNEWNCSGDGESQTARLVDDDDATCIHTGTEGRVSSFALDCSRLPRNAVVRAITLSTREFFAHNDEQLRCYEVYVDGEPYWFVLVPRRGTFAFGSYTTRVAGPENGFPPIAVSPSKRIAVAFRSSGLRPGERWAVSRLRVELGCVEAERNPVTPVEMAGSLAAAFYH